MLHHTERLPKMICLCFYNYYIAVGLAALRSLILVLDSELEGHYSWRYPLHCTILTLPNFWWQRSAVSSSNFEFVLEFFIKSVEWAANSGLVVTGSLMVIKKESKKLSTFWRPDHWIPKPVRSHFKADFSTILYFISSNFPLFDQRCCSGHSWPSWWMLTYSVIVPQMIVSNFRGYFSTEKIIFTDHF